MLASHPAWWGAVMMSLIAWMFLQPVRLLPHMRFGLDELQHLHVAYCIHHGLVPYRDFFEHHVPWFHYILSWLFPITGETITTILVARWGMLGLTLANLYLTYRLGRRIYNGETGLVAAVVLACTVMFYEKTFEIRPDVPATTCWLAGLWAFLRGMETARARWYVISGLTLGAGAMFTQKLGFGLAGILPMLAWMLIDPRVARDRWRGRSVLWFVGALAAPVLGTLFAFALQGGLKPFLSFAVLMNVGWPRELPASTYLGQFIREDPVLSVLGLGGWLVGTWQCLRDPQARRGTLILVGVTLSLMVGWFVISVPYRQYLLLLLPLWSIHAAALLYRAMDLPSLAVLRQRWASPSRRRDVAEPVIAALLIGAGLVQSARYGRPALHGSTTAYVLWWATIGTLVIITLLPRSAVRGVGIVAVGALASLLTPLGRLELQLLVLLGLALAGSFVPRRQLRLLTLLLIGLIPFARQEVSADLGKSNAVWLAEIRYVLAHTEPDEPFFTGFRITGPFRPHTYFYYFLNNGVRSVLGERQLGDDVVNALATKRPQLLSYDDQLEQLPSIVQDYIREHYQPIGVGSLWQRKE
jgi:Dolichyl-phosphate-mannose-protein mannosyltransferase